MENSERDGNTRPPDLPLEKYCLQKTHLKPTDTYRLKMRGWKKIFHANGDQKKAGIAVLISNKIDFKIKNVIRDKEGH